MKQVIHLFGAAGSGTSTLGKYLSEQLGYFWMDTDDYMWEPTDPRFTKSRPKEERVRLIKQDLDRVDHAVLSGSIADWGNELIPRFTLAIRVVTDTDTRIRRIKEREYGRFGDRILPGGDMYEQHQDFLRWASSYDDGDITMRSMKKHDEWQKQLKCPLLILSGSEKVETNYALVKRALERIQNGEL